MAITVDYLTKVISVPQADLTLISGTLYELDTNQFRLDLASIQGSEEGIWADTMFSHNTEVTIAGTTFARTIEIINGYSIEFEDGQYTVRLVGSNNNIFDVQGGILVQNQVQVLPTNSAGLINAFADILDENVTTHNDVNSVGEALNVARDQATIAATNTQS